MTATMPLAKYEGLGNDFLVLVDLEGSWPVSA
jgi:diaminopimelate epimerase